MTYLIITSLPARILKEKMHNESIVKTGKNTDTYGIDSSSNFLRGVKPELKMN